MQIENAITKCIKSFDLTSAESVARDNGVISGTASFTRNGCEFNGTDTYVTYNIPNTLFASPKISIVVEFTPDFSSTAGTGYFFFDSTGSQRNMLFQNGTTNYLAANLGGTSVLSSAPGVYGSSWKQNERNVLVVSGTSGNNKMWLNGNEIATSSTAWTAKAPSEFYIGANYLNAYKFDGEIHSISIYNDLLTADDAQNLYDNSTFNFQNKASIWLDMVEQKGGVMDVNETELLVDGNMEAVGSSDWGEAANTDVTKENSDLSGSTQCVRITGEGTNNPYIFQNDILVVGRTYRIRGYVRSDGNATPHIAENPYKSRWTGTTSTDWQYFDFRFKAEGTGLRLYGATTADVGHYSEFDLVELYETKELLADNDMEAVGVGAWDAINNAVVSKEESSLSGSTQCIRITGTGTYGAGCRQNILSINKRYRVTGWARGDGNVNSTPRIYLGSVKVWEGTTSTDWQYFDIVASSSGSNYFSTYLPNSNAGEWIEYDNISIKEVLQYTPDKSGNGNHTTLGDGGDTTLMPSFLNSGFETDGGDYMQTSNSGFVDTSATELSIVAVVDVNSQNNTLLAYEPSDLSAVGAIILKTASGIEMYMGAAGGTNAAKFDDDKYSQQGKIVIIGTQDGTATSVYIDGRKGDDATSPAAVNLDSSQVLTLFVRGNLSTSKFGNGGRIYHVSMYPFKLSQTQIRQLTSYLKNKYN